MIHPLCGTWYNQHGSELVLDVDDAGKLTGTIHSGIGLAASSGVCKVTGFVAGDLVTFSADFGQYASLTAWTGHHVTHGQESLQMMWHMSVTVPSQHPDQDLWKGVWTGSDVFRRKREQAAASGRVPSHPVPQWRP